MMAFLEFTFRSGAHFMGIVVLIIILGIVAQSIVSEIMQGLRRP